jgi:tetratricopeptide (TPR) repeat protein
MQQQTLQQLEQWIGEGSRPQICVWGLPGIGKSLALEGLERTFLGRTERLRVGESVSLQGLDAQVGSKILLLDDLHKISGGEDWALELGQTSARAGHLLVVTHRSPLPAPYFNLELPPMAKAELEGVLEGVLNGIFIGAAPLEAGVWLEARVGGHPLFALEYVRYLMRQGFLWSDGSRWRWRTPPEHFFPPTIEALVQSWLQDFSANALEQRVLESATLLPQNATETFALEVLALPQKQWQAAQNRLERLGFLRGIRPSHPLIAEGIVRGLSSETRSHHANAILQALAKYPSLEPTPALITGAKLDTQHTLNLYLCLAQDAKTKGDQSQAGNWLARACEHAPQQQQIPLALEAAQLLRYSALEQAVVLAQRAASGIPPLPEAVLLCAELDLERGETARAEGWLALLSSDTPETVQAQQVWELRLKLLHSAHPRHTEALELWKAYPERQPLADPETVLKVGNMLSLRGDFQEALALSGPLLERPNLSAFVRCRALEFQSTLHQLQTHLVSAETYVSQAISVARTLERPSYLAKLLQKLHVILVALDRIVDAETPLREALELFGKHGPPLELAYAQSSLGKHLGELGTFEEAETLLLESLSALEKLDHALLCCDAAIGLTALYVVWQPPYAGPLVLKYARMALTLAERSANQQMQHLSLIYVAVGESKFGNAASALEYAEKSSLPQFTGPSTSRKSRSQFVRGLALAGVGQREEGIQEMSAALQQYQLLGDTYQYHVYGLELDYLQNNLEGGAVHHAWFVQEGYLGKAKMALRYFPVLETPDPTADTALHRIPVLHVLGSSLLEQHGKRSPYKGRKRLELLAFLLESRIGGREEATLLELMDALYAGSQRTRGQGHPQATGLFVAPTAWHGQHHQHRQRLRFGRAGQRCGAVSEDSRAFVVAWPLFG